VSVNPRLVLVDNDDFSAFYQRELVLQVKRATVLLRSSEAANDVVHDAMVQVYRRWGELQEPGGYLNRAVINGCRDAARRRRTATRHQHQLVRPDATDATEDPLDDLFDRLPFQQRAAVVLRYYADLSHREIAEALGCPAGSVGPWIDRALRSLKEQLP
jgi:RNA polymerase sigma factor (sigma-70 family)